ncbi:MAG: hypothetical protein ACOCVC_08050 [Spirochaeta sp.]
MITGSTEVYVALQTALRRQLPITVHFPQRGTIQAVVSSVSHSYADLQCTPISEPDSQLTLVKISFPFRDTTFQMSTSARLLSPTSLRIDTDTAGTRKQELMPPTEWDGTEILPVQPAAIPSRPPLQRLHGVLQTIRELIKPWAEHRISIFSQPVQNETDRAEIQIRASVRTSPPDFCLPILPSEPRSRFDITIPISFQKVSFGSIDILENHTDPDQLSSLLTRLSTCGVAIAYELMQPVPTGSLYLLAHSPTGSLIFSRKPVRTAATGFELKTATGLYFTIPAGLSPEN